MMKAFAYRSPDSVADAVSALGSDWDQAGILAGGTDILSLMKDGLAEPQTLVDIKHIDALHEVEVGNKSIHLGAAVTLSDLASHSAVKKHLPALASAAAAIGGPQIRNRGTVGGNLCQRPRDWYFRSGLDAEKRAENQYGGIFVTDGMDYVSPSTLAPPLIAYGAQVVIQGDSGERKVPVEKFFVVSNLGDKRETVLEPNEIVTRVEVPVQGMQSADYEVRERDSHDWPLVQAAVALSVSDGKVSKANIVLGHVGPLPRRSKEAEAAITGKALNLETATSAGQAATQGAQPRGKSNYKVTLVQVAVKRALLAAVGQEYWRSEA